MIPPRPGRLYWVCQAAGWGSFTVYVLGGYLIGTTPDQRKLSDFFSIFFSNLVLCPLVSHLLRRELYRREWLLLPLRRLVPRIALVLVSLGLALTCWVALWVWVVARNPLDGLSFLSIFVGFTWALIGWFVIYYAVHSRRRRDALQLELAVVSRDAQLRSLRAQLNPHFLFNCLNSLRHLIGENPDRAVAMVTGLAELLRYSLASDRTEMVSLAEELQVVDEYLELERVRLEERLRIERAIEPAALATRIPPMLIQTLVDNAIKHGIADLPRGGVVRLGARVTEAGVEIVIENTGTLKPPTSTTSGHGLRNATERLRLLYDGAASLTLGERDGMTRAVVLVPAK